MVGGVWIPGLREEGLGGLDPGSEGGGVGSLDSSVLNYLLPPGCTVVVLVPPASPTPLLLAQLAGELGPFPGILNVISGPASLGPVLAAQPGVQKVAFCGAIEVSWRRGGGAMAGEGPACSAPC